MSDPNDGSAELSVTWFVGDAEVCAAADPAADGTTVCDTFAPTADAEVRLEVRDPEGAVAVARAALVVLPNSTPSASIVSPVAGGIFCADQLITFQGVVGDAEDAADTLTVWWESSLSGALDVDALPTSSGEVLGYGNLEEGEHAIELHALDSAGNEAVESVTIEVGAPNSAPSCGITAPADGASGEEGGLVTFRGTVGDVDVAADWLAVTWSSDKDGALGTSTPDSAGNVVLAYSDLSTNTHVLTMLAKDEVGATCSAFILYTVGSPPTIVLSAPLDGEVVNEGESLTFSATVSDGEDRASDLVVRWESTLDGVLSEGAPDSAGVSQFLDSGLSAGDHELTVR